eukprot:TRINITY_DN1706_c2_g1_i2.p1 TRINITY_DN1706_c2_g1~~TRINITY_DN1706_c2_g1_i2.p1  ORF type:complete len:582 (+),score=187.47 TRINITY_DN1706_c2_g1_i2:170-1747(+)
MANSCAFRVQKDLKEVMQSPNTDSPPIYVTCVEDKLDHVVAMMVGPPQTPYHFGFFSFDMRFPQTYPNEPPKVKISTTDFGRVRFNPNLYADGKVCLSILGTWRGETSEIWRSAYSVGYVLNAIQSLIMNAEPYHNEPGFEKEMLEQDIESDDDKGVSVPMFVSSPSGGPTTPQNIPSVSPTSPSAASGAATPPNTSANTNPLSTGSVVGGAPSAKSPSSSAPVPVTTSSSSSSSPAAGVGGIATKKRRRDPEDVRAEAAAYADKIQHESLRVAVCDVLEAVMAGKTEYFRPEIKREFLMRYETYVSVAETGLPKDGQAFVKTPFEYPTNLAEGKFDYKTLLDRLRSISQQLEDETESWRQKGAELTKRKSYIASTLRDEHARLLQDGMHGCSGGPVDPDNVFVWNLSIMQPEGLFEEGMFNVEIVFPESKDEYPRVRFKTPIFHPNISPAGYACFSIPPSKQESIDFIFSSIRKLLCSEPNPSTATWVNLEAAELCFSQDADKQKLWRRKAKQLARQSMEDPQF